MNEETNRLTAALVRLARHELHGDSLLSDEAGFARLDARISTPRRPGTTRWLLGGLALAGAVAAAFALIFLPRTRVLSFEVTGAALSASGQIVATERTHIHFSDGSDASLSSGTEARIQNLTEHGAELVLARGSMRIHVAKKAQASWSVAAGPYDVRVTGTAFDVSWSKETQAFDLRMETGAVIVSGPFLRGAVPLKAGEHMFGSVALGRLTVERDEPASVPAASSVAATEPPSGVEPAPEIAEPRTSPEAALLPSTVPSAARANSEAHSWTRQVAAGHFEAVLEQAERRGWERTLGNGSLDELAALADAARYAGRSSVAKRVLLAERQRFPGSRAAQDAAFFLGRIAEDSGAGGIDWYERYLSESPQGVYASQALGRRMMLIYKQRGPGAASSAAVDYLSRYPNGPYAAAARKLAQESSSAPRP